MTKTCGRTVSVFFVRSPLNVRCGGGGGKGSEPRRMLWTTSVRVDHTRGRRWIIDFEKRLRTKLCLFFVWFFSKFTRLTKKRSDKHDSLLFNFFFFYKFVRCYVSKLVTNVNETDMLTVLPGLCNSLNIFVNVFPDPQRDYRANREKRIK